MRADETVVRVKGDTTVVSAVADAATLRRLRVELAWKRRAPLRRRQRGGDVPWTNSATERATGGSEIRYKTVRGYKSEYWMLSGFGLGAGGTAWICLSRSRRYAANFARGAASSETRPKMTDRFWDGYNLSLELTTAPAAHKVDGKTASRKPANPTNPKFAPVIPSKAGIRTIAARQAAQNQVQTAANGSLFSLHGGRLG